MAVYRVRGGATIRKRLNAVRQSLKSKHKCPVCGKAKVKRTSFAVWECKSCKARFAGGAYSPETLTGKSGKRAVVGEA